MVTTHMRGLDTYQTDAITFRRAVDYLTEFFNSIKGYCWFPGCDEQITDFCVPSTEEKDGRMVLAKATDFGKSGGAITLFEENFGRIANRERRQAFKSRLLEILRGG